jgi:hypothetical protein
MWAKYSTGFSPGKGRGEHTSEVADSRRAQVNRRRAFRNLAGRGLSPHNARLAQGLASRALCGDTRRPAALREALRRVFAITPGGQGRAAVPPGMARIRVPVLIGCASHGGRAKARCGTASPFRDSKDADGRRSSNRADPSGRASGDLRSRTEWKLLTCALARAAVPLRCGVSAFPHCSRRGAYTGIEAYRAIEGVWTIIPAWHDVVNQR